MALGDPDRNLVACVYTIPAELATDCEKEGCDEIGWVQIAVKTDQGERRLSTCKDHAGDFLIYALPLFGHPEMRHG